MHKPSIGLLRRGLQLGVVRVESDCLTLKISQNMESNCLPVNKLKFVSLQILYVTLYQLWYAQGYQEQASIESSVTTKVISFLMISLQYQMNLPRPLYELQMLLFIVIEKQNKERNLQNNSCKEKVLLVSFSEN